MVQPPCHSAVGGHYVRGGTRTPEGPNGLRTVTEVVMYQWEPDGKTPLISQLSALLGLDAETA
jgi:hypothetical protein